MDDSYKPKGYPTVSPYLIVTGASAAIAFMERVFDAVEIRRFADPAGRVYHAEVRIGDSVIMIADGGGDWPAVPAHVHIYVPDVDATHARALEAGAVSVQQPAKKEDADKRGGVRDAGGTSWWIATKIDR